MRAAASRRCSQRLPGGCCGRARNSRLREQGARTFDALACSVSQTQPKGGGVARQNMRDQDGDNLFFLLLNTNKRSFTLNLNGRGKELSGGLMEGAPPAHIKLEFQELLNPRPFRVRCWASLLENVRRKRDPCGRFGEFVSSQDFKDNDLQLCLAVEQTEELIVRPLEFPSRPFQAETNEIEAVR
jgi:hypothetical protein